MDIPILFQAMALIVGCQLLSPCLIIHKKAKKEWDRLRDRGEKELGRWGGDFDDILDSIHEGIQMAFHGETYEATAAKRKAASREAWIIQMRALGGSEFEVARPTAQAVQSAKGSSLQPSGTTKFVVPRSRKRQRGLVSQFDLGSGGGSLNVGGGESGLQI